MRNPLASSLLASALLSTAVLAAPRITGTVDSSPSRVQVGQRVVFQAQDLAAPLAVYFSDGTDPVVASSAVSFDLARGFLVVDVPEGARTGDMSVVANGVPSAPFWVTVDETPRAVGPATVQGTVTTAGGPLAGAHVVLLRPDGCDDQDVVDVVTSGASGQFTLHGAPGPHFVYVFPPAGAAVPPSGVPVSLSGSPATVEIDLGGGTTLEGSVVRASDGTGVAFARVEVESDGGFDTLLADANGAFVAVVPPGHVRARITPPSPDVASTSVELEAGASSPQSLAPIELQSGVRIHGFVRAGDGSPLANVRVSARESMGCCGDADESVSRGDGGFDLVVPPNRTYQIQTSIDRDAAFVDARVDNLVVGAADVGQDLVLERAGAIVGFVLDAVSAAPLANVQVQASVAGTLGMSAAFAQTCADGSYRLRVAPGGPGYVATAGLGDPSSPTVPVAWNGTEQGTFYLCEGTPIAVASATTVVSNVTLRVRTDAVSASGTLLSQASSCSLAANGPVYVLADDGGSHACGLGSMDWTVAAPDFRLFGLPPAEAMPAGLRVCAFSASYAPQCYDLLRPPAFDAVVIGAGQQAAGVDFCLGDRPTTEVRRLRASKNGGVVTFTWDATGDVYQTEYRLRGAMSARPSAGRGSFPADPAFDMLWSGATNSASISLNDPRRFFVVTNAGPTGSEGPSGCY